ncbi:MAG: cell division protein ZapA [Deltaproteobacteria bacterium]|jgi:cell division protein ZapA|nr:cell division protein ZapA [Deltaproteobacteria bacterium]
MQHFTVNVLGLEISFKADADSDRLEQAIDMLDKRAEILRQHSRQISKEKLLTLLALALADDLLILAEQTEITEAKVQELVRKIEAGMVP